MDNWFSNFKPMDEPWVFNGLSYPTVEHFYQAMKTTDPELKSQIANAPTASEAKRLGRSVKLRSDWESIKLIMMEIVLLYKFRKGTTWYTRLMATNGDEIIETNNWHDNYYGNCICQRCKDIRGKNMLGRLLMKIRNAHIVKSHMINLKQA